MHQGRRKKLIADIDGLKLRCCSYDALRKLSESESAAEKSTAAAAKGEKYQCPFQFFTGLRLSHFDSLWAFLQPSKDNVLSRRQATSAEKRSRGGGPQSVLSLHDQLVMVLMRLRLSLLEGDLAYRYGVHESTVSRTFIKWCNFLYLQLGSLPIWPTWDAVERTIPTCFKKHTRPPSSFWMPPSCLWKPLEVYPYSPKSTPPINRTRLTNVCLESLRMDVLYL